MSLASDLGFIIRLIALHSIVTSQPFFLKKKGGMGGSKDVRDVPDVIKLNVSRVLDVLLLFPVAWRFYNVEQEVKHTGHGYIARSTHL